MGFAHDILHGGIVENYYEDSHESNTFYIVEKLVKSKATGNMWMIERSAYSSSGIQRTDLEKYKLLKDCLDDPQAPLEIRLKLEALRLPKFTKTSIERDDNGSEHK